MACRCATRGSDQSINSTRHTIRLAEFLPYFRSQFAYVGPGCMGGETAAATDDPLFEETPNCFRLWCSGRRHLQGGMAVTLRCPPRHDVLRRMMGAEMGVVWIQRTRGML